MNKNLINKKNVLLLYIMAFPNLSEMWNVCVKMPNMGAFLFYAIFVFLVPIFTFVIKMEHLLTHYLPLLVPIAITLTVSGKPDLFNKLYPVEKTDYVGFISKNIINLISITAIVWMALQKTRKTGNVVYGASIGLTMLVTIFFLSPFLLPFLIKKVDVELKDDDRINLKYNWHRYLTGIAFIICILIIEVFLIDVVYSRML